MSSCDVISEERGWVVSNCDVISEERGWVVSNCDVIGEERIGFKSRVANVVLSNWLQLTATREGCW
jgi:hypothetical protein